MLRSLRVLLLKEFLQIRRDPVILGLLFIMPLLQLVVLANAATFEVKTSRLWVVDQDRSAASGALVQRFTATGRFDVVGYTMTADPGDEALLDGAASAVLVIPSNFARDLQRDGAAPLQLVLNAENGAEAGVIQSYAAEIVSRYAVEAGASRRSIGASAGALRPVIDVRTRNRYNPGMDYSYFMVPGILVQLITLIGTLMTALNIVREKENGTLEQLNVTPMRPAVFLAAKLLPLWIISMGEFVAGILIAVFLFNVPLLGSPLVMLVGAALFLLAALGLGLWVSTVTETQQQALFVTFSLIMVYLLMSGLFTPVRAMPDWVRMLAQLNPMMHFIELVRAVMLKGAGWADVWRQLLPLAGLGFGVLALSVSRYHKRTD
jgi:ABC-2 type transport system permease protein